MIPCAHCQEPFQPRRKDQRFHQTACRMAFHQARYRREVHKCPLCGDRHDPGVGREEP